MASTLVELYTGGLPPSAPHMAGLRICMTGTMSLSRASCQNVLKALGAVPVDNVTRTGCDVLVSSETGTSKMSAAVRYGIKIVSEAQLVEMILSQHHFGGGVKTAEPKPKEPQPDHYGDW